MLPEPPLHSTSTLEPLRSEGPDALIPDPDHGITAVKLRKLEATWHNAYNKRTTAEADDLFRCAAAEDDSPIPPNAELTAATLEFFFNDLPEAQLVEIRPPNRLHPASDHPRITRYLTARHFLQFALALFFSAFAEPDLLERSDQPRRITATPLASAA